MTTEKLDPAIEQLNALVSSVTALLTQLEATLTELTKETEPLMTVEETSKFYSSFDSKPAVPGFDCLKAASGSAALIKAHTTKLSLLIITEPFTPTAISKVLRELVSGAVPSLATAAEFCRPAGYTFIFSQAFRLKCHSLLRELRTFVQKIPADGKVLSEEQRQTATDGTGKGSLPMTGVLWSICDDLARFADAGVGSFFVNRIEETRLTLKDIVDELTEWQEESDHRDDDDDDDNDGEDSDGGAADSDSAVGLDDSLQTLNASTNAQALLDDLMNSAKLIPRDDTQKIRPRLRECLRSLKLTMLMCQAVSKRRLKTLPPFPVQNYKIPMTLQKVFRHLGILPQKYEDVVMAFYELDPTSIDKNLSDAISDVVGVIAELKQPWAGSPSDGFSSWYDKFRDELQSVGKNY